MKQKRASSESRRDVKTAVAKASKTQPAATAPGPDGAHASRARTTADSADNPPAKAKTKARRPQPPAPHTGATRCLILEPRLKNPLRGTERPASATTSAAKSVAKSIGKPAASDRFSNQRKTEEIIGLAQAIDLDIVDNQICPLNTIRPATYFTKGHIDQAAAVIAEHEIDVVIVDTLLTPGQQRNLERALNAKVLDRTGLILEIFGERARTREGTLQVELAHLTYQRSRLVRSWTHLERQRGGAGFLGGPGETQLEADRRELAAKIQRLEKALADVKRTRGLHRKVRGQAPHTVIALIGYTNAGKSTLFNALTKADVLVQDQVFATLDPTMRAVKLDSGAKAIVSDTVGFISNLPTELVAAFRATLEEVQYADILLHVRDISDPECDAQADSVHEVLQQLGLDGPDMPPMIEVLNKVDLVDETHPNWDKVARVADEANKPARDIPQVLISAITGAGLDDLNKAIDAMVNQHDRIIEVDIGPEQGRALAWLHQHADVLAKSQDDTGTTHLQVSLKPQNLGRFEKEFGITPILT